MIGGPSTHLSDLTRQGKESNELNYPQRRATAGILSQAGQNLRTIISTDDMLLMTEHRDCQRWAEREIGGGVSVGLVRLLRDVFGNFDLDRFEVGEFSVVERLVCG